MVDVVVPEEPLNQDPAPRAAETTGPRRLSSEPMLPEAAAAELAADEPDTVAPEAEAPASAARRSRSRRKRR
jgi:hypothetical protein